MSHFALVVDNIVQQVIVAEQDFIDEVMTPAHPEGVWIQTSYNTKGGVHYNQETGSPSDDQTKALRYNFAGIGSTYDPEADAFIPVKPYASWVLDTSTYTWKAPVDRPEGDGPYRWDEETLSWLAI